MARLEVRLSPATTEGTLNLQLFYDNLPEPLRVFGYTGIVNDSVIDAIEIIYQGFIKDGIRPGIKIVSNGLEESVYKPIQDKILNRLKLRK